MGYGAVFSGDQRGVFGDDERGSARFDRALADWMSIQDDERLAIHIDSGGRASVHRKDVLVVADDDVVDRRVEETYRDIGVNDDEYGRAREDAARADSPGFTSVRVGTNQCVVAATKFLRGLGGRRPLRVAPDNVLWPFQGRVFGPAFPPEWTPAPAAAASAQVAAGDRVRVAVLDTGYIPGNPLLDQLSVRRPGDDEDPWWSTPPPAMAHWVGGHGTHVAGVLAAAASSAVELHHFNVGRLGVGESGVIGPPLISDTDLAEAVHAALDLGCRVINMSLGGPTALDLGLPAVSLAIRAAAGPEGTEGAGRDDSIIVAAAGNEATTQPMFPAASKGVLGVGALDDSGDRAEFSNHGPWVDCAADGVDVLGPYVSELVDPADPNQVFQGWATWTGTSFAAPFVAGRIAAQLASGATDSARVAAAMVLAGGTPLPAALQLGVRIG